MYDNRQSRMGSSKGQESVNEDWSNHERLQGVLTVFLESFYVPIRVTSRVFGCDRQEKCREFEVNEGISLKEKSSVHMTVK